MRVLKASDLAKEYYKKGYRINIPIIPESETSFIERIMSICKYHQNEEIQKKIGKLPSQKKLITTYLKRYEKELREGTGRDELIKKIPEYKNPEKIPEIIKKEYKENPSNAGEYAHKLIGFNTANSVPLNWFYPNNEKTRDLILPNTDIYITFRPDLEDCFMGLYEFKLTTKKHQESRLHEAIIQLYIYDFLQRIKFNIKSWRGMVIEIALIDEEKILYFDLFKKPIKILSNINQEYYFENKNLDECKDYYNKEVKETLKKLFNVVCKDQYEKIKEHIDKAYYQIRPKTYADEEQAILRHKINNEFF